MKERGGTFFIPWDQAFNLGPAQAGGKGWNLARLDKFGFRIPPGGILSTDAYIEFVNYNGLYDDMADISNRITATDLSDYTNELSELEEKIKSGLIPQAITDEISIALQNLGLIDKAIAVRSSASVFLSK